MKALSWPGAIIVIAAVAIGTASAIGVHAADVHSVAALRAAVVVTTPAGSGSQAPTRPFATEAVQAPAAAGTVRPKAPAAAAPYVAQPLIVRSTQQALINQDRARHGLGPLTWSSCLGSIAYSNALRMAGQGYMSHTNGAATDLGCGLGRRAGENVGWWSGGVNDTQINTMFMNSAEHVANILGPYHYVGTAWVRASNGVAYIAVEFS